MVARVWPKNMKKHLYENSVSQAMRRTGAESTVDQKHAATTKTTTLSNCPGPRRYDQLSYTTPHLRLGQTRNRKKQGGDAMYRG